MSSFTRHTELPLPPDDVRAWLHRPGAGRRLVPAWYAPDGREENELRFRSRLGGEALVVLPADGTTAGAIRLEGIDTWDHRVSVLAHQIDARASVFEDEVLHQGAGGSALQELVRIFDYRHRTISEDLTRHREYGLSPLTIAVTGSSGFIGRALMPFLTSAGHSVVRIVRGDSAGDREPRSPLERTAWWNPGRGMVEEGAFEGVDVVIHLAGEPIFDRRWSRRQKARILDSRVRSTRLLAETLAASADGPGLLITASGASYYGDRGHEVLNEASAPGTGFLADVCRHWERASEPAERAGIRVCRMRLGVVLSPSGGVLGGGLPVLRRGLGAAPGTESAWVPWITIDDILYAVLHLIGNEQVFGAFNVSSPHPVTMRRLTDTLASVIGRSRLLRLPRPFVRLAAGREMQRAAGASIRMVPEHLANSGFRFAYPELMGGLGHLLGRTTSVTDSSTK